MSVFQIMGRDPNVGGLAEHWNRTLDNVQISRFDHLRSTTPNNSATVRACFSTDSGL